MTDPQYTQPPRPPIVQISPTEMAGAWLEEVRGKLAWNLAGTINLQLFARLEGSRHLFQRAAS
jgi:hypothetical protein